MFQKNQEKMSSSRRKNILYVNSMNFRQDQVKETTSKLQPHMLNQALLTLTDHQTSLLNLGPRFAPAEKRIPFMEIIIATKSVALNLEYRNKEADTESLQQNLCHILNKNRNMKINDNLSKEQRKALKEIRQINSNTKVYPFGKG